MNSGKRLIYKIASLLLIIVVCSLTLGMVVPPACASGSPGLSEAAADSTPSVDCIPLGLYGSITADVLVGRLSDSSDNLVFLGTSNGLYVMSSTGMLQHFIYTPSFGVQHVALINDINGDGVREVVVALNDTEVPALRCYDGATWKGLWQFGPMTKVWDELDGSWAERQFSITDLEVIRSGDSQSIVITAGRCIFSVDARDGKEQWSFQAPSTLGRMAVVTDLNGDGVDEVFVGSEDGHLYLLSGNTGRPLWQTRLPEYSDGSEFQQAAVNDVLAIDKDAGEVAAVSTDGEVRLFDLRSRELKWAVSISSAAPVRHLTLLPNAMTDGSPGVLGNYALSYGPDMANEEDVVLLDAAGNMVWDRKLSVFGGVVKVGSFLGKSVILEPKGQEIDLIDPSDGESVLQTIPIATLDSQAPTVQQIGTDSLLLVSSGGDLAAISFSGEQLWHYPRISNVTAENGNFVGDSTQDVLFCGEWGSNSNTSITTRSGDGMTITTETTGTTPVQQANVRSLFVMDGATKSIAWSYEVPPSELATLGGLEGVCATPDLVGDDSIQDIAAYRGDTVYIFSGKDGTLSTFSVGQPVESLEIMRNGAAGTAIALGTSDGLLIVDSTGTELWTSSSTAWVGAEGGNFMILDDINADNVSDLAVVSSDNVTLLESMGSASSYEPYLSFGADAGCSIEYIQEVTADKDGVRALAYIERAATQPGQGPSSPVLLERSTRDGRVLLQEDLPGTQPAIDIACGDFNGDGYADTLLCKYPQEGISGEGPTLEVLSGKDGSILWTHVLVRQSAWGYSSAGGWNSKPPAASVGDVNGDGADELVCTGEYLNQEYRCWQTRLEVYDVADNTTLKDIPATPSLNSKYYSNGISIDETMLQADVDGDGHPEIIMGVFEPSLPLYDSGSNGYSSQSKSYLAVMDIDSGQRLAAFMGFDPAAISLFETHQPGILGVAAYGGVYFLNVSTHLNVTAPESGSKTGPSVGVKLEGTSDGEFVQVFVDGVRNRTSNDMQTELYLARGEHDIVVSSIDGYGRMSYFPTDLGTPIAIKVTPSPWKPVLLVLSLFILAVLMLLLFYPRLHREWRDRRGVAK